MTGGTVLDRRDRLVYPPSWYIMPPPFTPVMKQQTMRIADSMDYGIGMGQFQIDAQRLENGRHLA